MTEIVAARGSKRRKIKRERSEAVILEQQGDRDKPNFNWKQDKAFLEQLTDYY